MGFIASRPFPLFFLSLPCPPRHPFEKEGTAFKLRRQFTVRVHRGNRRGDRKKRGGRCKTELWEIGWKEKCGDTETQGGGNGGKSRTEWVSEWVSEGGRETNRSQAEGRKMKWWNKGQRVKERGDALNYEVKEREKEMEKPKQQTRQRMIEKRRREVQK